MHWKDETTLKEVINDLAKMTGREVSKEKEEKIIALEEKIAWLEEQLDAQANELNNIYDKMYKLERQFKILYSKVGDPYATRAMKDEVPPPHY